MKSRRDFFFFEQIKITILTEKWGVFVLLPTIDDLMSI